MTLQVRVVGPEGEREYHLDQPFARVGSHPRSEVCLEGPQVARRHLYLHATPQGVYCIDFEYRKAFGHRVDYWVSRTHGVQVGPYKLLAAPCPAPAEDSRRERFWNTRPPAEWTKTPVLTFVHRGKLMGRYPIRRRLISIGRHPLNNVRCKAPSVSDFHAVVYWEADQLWVIDLFASGKSQLFGAEFDVSDFHRQTKLRLGRVAVAHSWTDDWKTVIEQYQTLWQPRKKRSQRRAADGEAPPDPGTESTVAGRPAPPLAAATMPLEAAGQPPALPVAGLMLAEPSLPPYATGQRSGGEADQAELAESRAQLQQLQAAIEGETARLAELRAAGDAENAAREAAAVERQARWERELAARQAEWDERERAWRSAAAQRAAEQHAWEQSQAEFTAERQRAVAADQAAAARRDALGGELEQLRENLAAAQAGLERSAAEQRQLETDLHAVRSERAQAADQLQALRHELTALQERQQAQDAAERELQTQRAAQAAELEQLRGELDLARREHARREQVAVEQAAEWGETLSRLQNQLAAAEAEAAARNRSAELAAEQAAEWQRRGEESSARLQTELTAVHAARVELDSLRETLAVRDQQLIAAVRTAAADQATANATLATLQQAYDELRRQLAVTRSEGELQIEQLKRAVETWQAEADLRARELDQLKGTFAASAEASANSLRQLQREFEQLRHQGTPPEPPAASAAAAQASPDAAEFTDVPVVAIPDLGRVVEPSPELTAAEASEVESVQEALFDHLHRLRSEHARWRRMLRRFGFGRQ